MTLTDSALITAARDLVDRIEARLIAIEELITPTGMSQADIQHAQVDYPYWRNNILGTLNDTSATPNYGAPFRRLTLDVIAMCLVGNVQADGVELQAKYIQMIGSLQFQRRSLLQSPDYPQGLGELDVTSLDNGLFRGSTLGSSDETGGAVYAVSFRLSLPLFIENPEISEA